MVDIKNSYCFWLFFDYKYYLLLVYVKLENNKMLFVFFNIIFEEGFFSEYKFRFLLKFEDKYVLLLFFC